MYVIRLIPLLLLLASAETRAGDLFRANLVKDVNTLPAQTSSDPDDLHVLGDKVYFVATRQDVGRELFATNGVSPDAQLVADFAPGSASSSPTVLGSAGGKLVVSTIVNGNPPVGRTWSVDPASGERAQLLPFEASLIGNAAGRVVFGGDPEGTVWVSDGTAAGTSALLEGGGPGVERFSKDTVCRLPERFQLLRRAPGGLEMWTSDGTAAGTQMLQLLADSGDVRYADTVGGTCYFATMEPDFSGWKLWRSDGTVAGTGASLASATGTPTLLRTTADAAYLLAYDAGSSQLWLAGQAQPFDVQSTEIAFLEATGSAIAYRVATSGGANFVVRDGSSAPARVVQFNGAPLQLPGGMDSELVAVGNLLFARGNEKLYAIDPVAATAALVASDADVFLQNDYVERGGVAYGIGSSMVGRELWRSDGTAGGTRLLHDVAWGTGDGMSHGTVVVTRGDTIFFNAIEDITNGSYRYGLIRSDGSEAGTQWVPRGAYDNGSVSTLTAFGNGVAFSTYDASVPASNLYRVDAGLTQSQRLLGPAAGIPALYGEENLLLYRCPGGDDSMCAIRAATGTPETVASASGGSQLVPVGMVGNAMLYFHRSALWRSDGTAPGTYALANLVSLQNWSVPFSPLWGVYSIVRGGRIYFQACTAQVASSCGLYATDGAANPMLLASTPDSYLTQYGQYQDKVVFATGGTGASQLWTSGGTPQTTQIALALPHSIFSFANAGGLLHFKGYSTGAPAANYYVTDTTAAGTRQVPLPVGTYAEMASSRTAVYDDHVLFSCMVPGYGNEICVVDGAGTGLSTIIDIQPGPGHSYAWAAATLSDGVYFSADDGVHGKELWRVSRYTDALFADGFD